MEGCNLPVSLPLLCGFLAKKQKAPQRALPDIEFADMSLSFEVEICKYWSSTRSRLAYRE